MARSAKYALHIMFSCRPCFSMGTPDPNVKNDVFSDGTFDWIFINR